MSSVRISVPAQGPHRRRDKASMLGKLYNSLAVLSFATVLALGAFAGYLQISGRLTQERVEAIAAVLRGERDPAPTSQPATSQPAEVAAEPEHTGKTEEELKELRQRKHLEMLLAERAARDLEAQRRLLDQVLQQVIHEQEKLSGDRAAFAAQQEQKQKTTATQLPDAGFKKELELVSGMPPRQAKEHVLRVWQRQPADAVRLVLELAPNTARKVLEQFKSPEEVQIRTDLLEQIRMQGDLGRATASRKTDGTAP